jgi:hypothetical protein
MNNVFLYRARTVWLSMGVTVFIVLSLVIETVSTRGIKSDLVAIAWGTFILTASYLLFIHPKIEIFDEGIRITNPLQRITVGWHRVESIEARYTMNIHVGSKVIHAWAAPAPSRYHSRSVHSTDIKGLDLGFEGQIRSSESPRSQSGQASFIAKLRLKEFQSAGIEGCESAVTINYFGATLLLGSLILALVFYALGF